MSEYTPAFPKIQKKEKSSKIWNKKPRLHKIDQPKEKHCKRCNVETGSERFAHLESFRRCEFGKGLAVKCDDSLTAWLCQKCTDIMDKMPYQDEYVKDGYFNKLEFERDSFKQAEEWMYLIIKTWLI